MSSKAKFTILLGLCALAAASTAPAATVSRIAPAAATTTAVPGDSTTDTTAQPDEVKHPILWLLWWRKNHPSNS